MNQTTLIKTQKEIGGRVRAVRERHHLSQEEMAEILGIRSRAHYQSIEYGRTQIMEKKMIILLIFSVLNGTMPRGIFFVM